jgi:hypothetical protein
VKELVISYDNLRVGFIDKTLTPPFEVCEIDARKRLYRVTRHPNLSPMGHLSAVLELADGDTIDQAKITLKSGLTFELKKPVTA